MLKLKSRIALIILLTLIFTNTHVFASEIKEITTIMAILAVRILLQALQMVYMLVANLVLFQADSAKIYM